jgi:RNA polymerase sigma-70 factor, ECF subfamily
VNARAGEDPIAREIEAARSGDAEVLGRVLQSCREYLVIVASRGIGTDLTAKGGASDLVQETFLGAYRDFDGFHGHSRGELLAWLRTILKNHLAVTRRRYRDTLKRKVSREVSLGTPGAEPFGDGGPADLRTPATLAVRREETEALLDALGRLPEDYRRVVVWHHYDGLTFEAIAPRLGRSAVAVRKVWSRALVFLTRELEACHEIQR